MRPTLFYLPHQIGPLPLFGIGWVLIGVLLYMSLTIFLAKSREQRAQILSEQLVVWSILIGVIVFLLPRIESRIDDGTPRGFPIGLPIRGYGVLLMCGVASAIGIGVKRCRAIGISNEQFYSFTVMLIVSGIVGARLFYVIQKWSSLDGDSWASKLWTALQFTEGGLVVYGGVLGGLVAVSLWSLWNKCPMLPLADAITPAFFIGLAFGRIGCLLNGCCFGGVCESPLPSIAFPIGAPAYMEQLESAQLLGLRVDPAVPKRGSAKIASVEPGSWADQKKLSAGQSIDEVQVAIASKPTREAMFEPTRYEAMVRVDRKPYYVTANELPRESLPVHPSQIYAAISGLLLCIWTLSLSQATRRIGVVFAAGLISYGILRNIEEFIRVDEAGQFGTSFSIAQWISFGAILFGIVLASTRRPLYPNDETLSRERQQG